MQESCQKKVHFLVDKKYLSMIYLGQSNKLMQESCQNFFIFFDSTYSISENKNKSIGCVKITYIFFTLFYLIRENNG